MMTTMDERIRGVVREAYGRIAKNEGSCCVSADVSRSVARGIGYGEKDLEGVPEGADLGLGCGNPVALASLAEGEAVLDLGSGAGLDCFLAAERVGRSGRVIGVDMTPEMIDRARGNARKGGYSNVEFRLGEIENTPVADNSVDVIISNCVINLSPDKRKVFTEAFRVLKPGGRVMISDIVLSKPLPDSIMTSPEAYVACLSGAIMKDDYMQAMKDAGFDDVSIIAERPYCIECNAKDSGGATLQKTRESAADRETAAAASSVLIQGFKRETGSG